MRKTQRWGTAFALCTWVVALGCGATHTAESPASPEASSPVAEPPAEQAETNASKAEPADPHSREAGLGLAGTRVVMRDPAAPDPSGSPTLTVRLESSAVSLGDDRIAVPSLESSKPMPELRQPAAARAEEARSQGDERYFQWDVADGVGAATFKSVMQTLAFSGWPDSRLVVGDSRVELRALMPGPPLPSQPAPPPGLEWPERPLVVMVEPTRTVVYRGGVEAPRAANRDDAPSKEERVGDVAASATVSQLSQLFSKACKGLACSPAMAFVDDAVSVERMQHVFAGLAAAAGKPSQPLLVELRIHDPSDVTFPIRAARRIGMGPTAVSGRLPPGEIQKIVRANFDVLRRCYEEGLGRDPKLEGRIQVRFVIGRQGEVIAAQPAGEAFPDRAVVDCVVAAYRTLRFPKPEGGIVTVVYPIQFSPE